MQKLNFSIKINAPKEKVWDTMLDKDTYVEWTKAFNPGSTYEGSWDQGSDIQFVGPNENGEVEGMYSRIKENRPYEFISIEHLGVILKGEKQEVSNWAGALENYTFAEQDGVTEVAVELDSDESLVDDFNKSWPLALQKLKELSEK